MQQYHAQRLKASAMHTTYLNAMYTNTILYKCYLTSIHLPYPPSILSYTNITSMRYYPMPTTIIFR